MKRNVALLATCQALLQSGNALLIASSGLVSLVLAPSPAYATAALGIQFLFTMTLTLPASLLMRRIGRRAGFTLGTVLGAAGAVFFSAGIQQESYAVFCVGAALFGAFNAFGQYYRFAAADVSNLAFRSRAISLVLAGGLVAAFLGPNLAAWSQDLVGTHAFLGSYLSLLALTLGATLVVRFVDIPPPSAAELKPRRRSLADIVLQPGFVVAALSAMISYGAMNLMMVSTPLAMAADGLPFHLAASVIQWHIVGMYAPSFFTGHLIHRFGALRMVMAGGFVLLLCVAVNLSDLGVARYWLALILLGVGWNFAFTSATTLLTLSYRLEEKALAQGLNDFLVFATMTVTSVASGALHAVFGWGTLNLVILAPLLLMLGAAGWLGRRTAFG